MHRLNYGEPEQALTHYDEAQRLHPAPINRLLAATVLPVVYESAADLHRWRKRLTESVERMAAEGVSIDTTRTLLPTGFFAAYQGANDRDLARALGQIYRGVELCPPATRGVATAAPFIAPSVDAPRSQRIRVGFLSAYFRDHTIGRLNLGRVQQLSRNDFEVTVIYAGRHEDEMTRAFAQAADRFLVVPREIEAARRHMAELELDVLVFADVGMDALTSTLAFSRVAPVQCVTWGHPATTGSPTMDFFISSELLETEEAESHYSECLVRLPNIGVYYHRPVLSGTPRPREFFGLDPQRHVYLCPQTLFKFHPDFDTILGSILQADPDGELVLIEGRVRNWTERLKRRFTGTLGETASRVRFLAAQPRTDFLHLLATADVILDPIHFGGGNSSYEALAVGTPIVTWPSRFLRGRITLALYRKMGLTDCVVHSAEDYVRVAVELARSDSSRAGVRERIRAASHVLFADAAEVRSLETFLRSAVQRSSPDLAS